jgi:hypothetical protein
VAVLVLALLRVVMVALVLIFLAVVVQVEQMLAAVEAQVG